jgi:hypothetical protein
MPLSYIVAPNHVIAEDLRAFETPDPCDLIDVLLRRPVEIHELRTFSFELSATGRPLYEGRGSHDDLVLALALAVWASERGGGGGEAFKEMMAMQVAARRT